MRRGHESHWVLVCNSGQDSAANRAHTSIIRSSPEAGLLRLGHSFIVPPSLPVVIAQRVHSTLVMLLMAAIAGCGTAVQRSGTEQLLLSDSVDRAVDQLDLSPLAGKRVYLDTEYMKAIKGNMFVNSEYIASAMRQKMTMSGCLIQTDKNAADYVLEARIGALGSDSMEVTYGIPSSNGIGQAATAITGFPSIAAIPEISVGKRNASIGVSKVMVYAYHRETGIPVWQSGDAIARSNATDSWMFGIGPLSRGSVYKSYRLAGIRLGIPFFRSRETDDSGPLSIADSHNFMHPAVLEKQLADAKAAEEAAAIRQAGHEEEIQKQ